MVMKSNNEAARFHLESGSKWLAFMGCWRLHAVPAAVLKPIATKPTLA